jgi:AraC-like DNA-binding protein
MGAERHLSEPNVLKKLADLLGTEVSNNVLHIPEKSGSGYCKGYIFNKNIRMLIMNYELNNDFSVENPDIDTSMRMILFKFQNIFHKSENLSPGKKTDALPSVLITTSSMNTDAVIPIHTNTESINIEVDADYLKELITIPGSSPVLHNLLQNNQPLLFEQALYSSFQEIIDEIIDEQVDETFKLFFLRIKAEELICSLLIELGKRDKIPLHALNKQDVQTIYRIKEQLLGRLDKPPLISELAFIANMSPSKLKRLFSQVFGSSIFNYYQEFRMKEAARLLKEEKLSVSDTGYQLGFTNLSHFSRVFKKHLGMKPKQYSRS